MGTRFELIVDGPSASFARSAGEEALEIIEDWHRRLNLFDRGSFLSHINGRAGAGPTRVDPDVFALLEACVALSEASEGAFDVTVAPMMAEAGLHPSLDGVAGGSRIGSGHVRLDRAEQTIELADGMALDLGGIAKGHALDAAAEHLRSLGVERALLQGGTSSVVAIGAPPDLPGWEIRVSDLEGAPVALLCDCGLSVSRLSGREVETDGVRQGHVLDPRVPGREAKAEFAGVVAASTRDADAWATALVVLGGRPAGMPGDVISILRDESDWRVEGEGAFERVKAGPLSDEQALTACSADWKET